MHNDDGCTELLPQNHPELTSVTHQSFSVDTNDVISCTLLAAIKHLNQLHWRRCLVSTCIQDMYITHLHDYGIVDM